MIVNLENFRYSYFENVDLSNEFDNQNLNYILNKSVL